ncbi:MAG: hypothetical protein HQL72_09245 [Magnetococcales bacterium]|nr:hypothetical protein [Magnetococcales bacterium]
MGRKNKGRKWQKPQCFIVEPGTMRPNWFLMQVVKNMPELCDLEKKISKLEKRAGELRKRQHELAVAYKHDHPEEFLECRAFMFPADRSARESGRQ